MLPLPTEDMSVFEIIDDLDSLDLGDPTKFDAISFSRPLSKFYLDLYGLADLPSDLLTTKDSRYRSGVILNHPAVTNKARYEIPRNYEELRSGTLGEETFLYCGTFWLPKNGYVSTESRFQASLCAFAVDIDRDPDFHFMGDSLAVALTEIFPANPLLKPQYITLTGTGVQLWYMFGRNIELYGKKNPRRLRYSKLVQALYGWWSDNLPSNQGKVDMRCASINHAFRAPASPTKQGYQTMVLTDRAKPFEPLDLPALADLLGVEFNEWDFHSTLTEEDISAIRGLRERREEAAATERQLEYIKTLHERGALDDAAFAKAETASIAEADTIIKDGESALTHIRNYRKDHGVVRIHGGAEVPKKPRSRKLYEYVLRRIPDDTPVGTRYFALCALAGYAYNCDVPRPELERDMMALLDTRMARGKSARDNRPLELKDVKAALKAYKPLGAVTHRETAEEWLGWSFGAPAKRNGRSQKQHLEYIARPMIDAYRRMGEKEHLPGRRSKEAEIKTFAKEHPEANHSEIARALGVSRPTVIKWLKSS
ncbi:MAG: hypothetical protein IJ087_06580 [Eggerthellaceae bacterium]|nr:hypothetical protein [Eggerthellaceae bacterium]